MFPISEMSGRSSLRKIQCRVCKGPVNRQGYSDHLRARHPEEDPKDVRVLGQGTIFGVKRKYSGDGDGAAAAAVEVEEQGVNEASVGEGGGGGEQDEDREESEVDVLTEVKEEVVEVQEEEMEVVDENTADETVEYVELKK